MHAATRNKTIIRLGTVVSLLPFFVLPVLMWSFFPRNNSPIQLDLWSQLKTAATGVSTPLAVVLLLGFCLAAVVIRRRGFTTAASLAVIVGATTIGGWVTSSYIKVPPGFKLEVPEGTKVWCNGVLLGEGTIEMSYEEFDKKVRPVDSPPEQNHVILGDIPPGFDEDYQWHGAKWKSLPGDPRGDYFGRHWPFFPGYSELMSVMAPERYWWRFEKDGYVAMDGKYVGFHGFAIEPVKSAQVRPKYPARERHIEVLSDLVKYTPFKPDAKFESHVEKYGIAGELEAVYRSKAAQGHGKNMSKAPVVRVLQNESEADQAFESIVDRVFGAKKLTTPSLESNELLQVGTEFPNVIKKRLRAALKTPGNLTLKRNNSEGSHGQSLGVDFSRQRIENLLVNSTACACRIVDESLFSEAVLHQQWSLIVLYERPEVVELLRTHLARRHSHYNTDDITFIRSDLQLAMQSNVPEVQEVVSEYLKLGDDSDFYLAREFVLRQLEIGADPTDLANWLSQCRAIDVDRRGGLLARIAPMDFADRMGKLKPDLNGQDRWLFKDAADPVLDWLIERAGDPPSATNNANFCMRALMANSSNKRVHEFVKQLLAEGRTGVYRVNNAIRDVLGEDFAWLRDEAMRLLKELDDSEHRAALAGFVAETFDSEEARELIVELAESDPAIKRAADRIENEHRAENQAKLKAVRLARSVIAGQISPQELLDTHHFVWKGAGYERQPVAAATDQ